MVVEGGARFLPGIDQVDMEKLQRAPQQLARLLLQHPRSPPNTRIGGNHFPDRDILLFFYLHPTPILESPTS